jgi:DNA-binding response OmpR family regulator
LYVTDENEESDQQRVLRRFEAMGIDVRLSLGGRCVEATMQTTGRSIETLNGSLDFSEIVFSTVGKDCIKCLLPSAFSLLPLISVIDCMNEALLEARIRSTWNQHLAELRNAENWLRELGADCSSAENGAMWNVSIAGEGAPVKVHVCEPRKVILPSRGPLSGITLMRAEDRTLDIDPCIDTAVDLEINISNRLDELASMDKRLKDEERRRSMSRPTLTGSIAEPAADRALRVLLVGEELCRQRSTIDSLRVRNYEVETARTLNEAVTLYDRMSPELVLADVNLGRSEGIELIPTLRSVVGLEEIPVILVDGHYRSARRQAAHHAGAIGYLTHPIDISSISARLEEIIKRPKRRRFTRYPQQVAINVSSSNRPTTALAIGRGGMMVKTDDDLAVESVYSFDLALSALGKRLQFEGEVLYQVNESGHQGVGLRFQSMTPQNEVNLIDYLHCLH